MALPATPLVEVAWLREHAQDVVVLDCSVDRLPRADGGTDFAPGDALFARGHIPGARFADVMQAFSDPAARFPFTCPSRAQFEQAARALGLAETSAIVAYDDLGGPYAARLWCLFRAFGLSNIRVLNGGFGAWKTGGHAVETGAAAPVAPGTLAARHAPDLFVGTEDVARMIAHPTTPEAPLLCGLRTAQFEAGHIPGSLNLPYPDLLGPDGRLEPGRVEATLASTGLGHGIHPILYCGGGINAAGLALALSLIGIENVKIYDDSMNGWKADATRPIATGAAP